MFLFQIISEKISIKNIFLMDPLKQNSIIIDMVSFNYYDVCDYCRDTVRKYTAPYIPISIDLDKISS
jgi:hypothetical protein